LILILFITTCLCVGSISDGTGELHGQRLCAVGTHEEQGQLEKIRAWGKDIIYKEVFNE